MKQSEYSELIDRISEMQSQFSGFANHSGEQANAVFGTMVALASLGKLSPDELRAAVTVAEALLRKQ